MNGTQGSFRYNRQRLAKAAEETKGVLSNIATGFDCPTCFGNLRVDFVLEASCEKIRVFSVSAACGSLRMGLAGLEEGRLEDKSC